MHFKHSVLFSLSALTLTPIVSGESLPALDFDWTALKPSADLEYHPCYDQFLCARLEVPLDWKNVSEPRRAIIAITKLPAVVADDDKRFGGAVFTNPGGPGGSGVDFVVKRGHNLRDLVDKPGQRHYEIVSFDPRGIGRTEPKSNCFPNNQFAREGYQMEVRGANVAGHSNFKIGYSLAINKGFSRECESAEDHLESGFRFAGTPSVARDMVEMVDKIEELRNSQLGKKPSRLELKKRNLEEAHAVGSSDEPADVPRLQYIGYSYGTILGNYFASMFPGRVGRVVLDGVSDAVDYSTGPGWLENLVDTDKIFENFFTGCYQAGPVVCAMARSNDKSAAQIKTRFWEWLATIDDEPIFTTSTKGISVVLTGQDVRALIGSSLYKPYQTFQLLSQQINEAMAGNGTLIADSLSVDVSGLKDSVCLIQNATVLLNQLYTEGGNGALCGDGDAVLSKPLAWWSKYFRQQTALSAIFGPYWSTIRFNCAHWPFESNWSFKGPFTTPKATNKPGTPAAPLLLLTTRLDPVTPLGAARRMMKGHPDSRLGILESMGHTTLSGKFISPELSAMMQEYFDTGKLPVQRETTYDAICGPWDAACPPTEGAKVFDSAEDQESILYRRRFPLGIM